MRLFGRKFARSLDVMIAMARETQQSFVAKHADDPVRRYSDGFFDGLRFARDLHDGKISDAELRSIDR